MRSIKNETVIKEKNCSRNSKDSAELIMSKYWVKE